jgi:hypothetical protein
VSNEDVEIGNWAWSSQSFTPSTDPSVRPNAVRVVGHREGLPLFFAAILGINETQVVREAVALTDGGRCRGIWGLEGVLGNGSVTTDSYDSQQGAYAPGNIYQNGDVCSNQDIVFHGGVNIQGDAMYGPDYDILISGTSYEIWGHVGGICCPVTPPVVDTSAARAYNDNDTIPLTDAGRKALVGGALRLVEIDNLTLAPGTYYFRSATIVGQATLTITGPTEIYLESDSMLTGGGIVNVTEDPAQLMIYSVGRTLSMVGGSGFYGAVVAPATDVTVFGDAELYGTIIGRTVDFRGDAIIHVDESIVADLMGGDGQVIPVLVR